VISVKNSRELELMRSACRIAANALALAGEHVKPGVTTWKIDRIAHQYILSQGARPSFLGHDGFPASACISVNSEVIHGIPSKERTLKQGDIVSVDLGARFGGFHGDNAATFAVGAVSDQARRLMDTTRDSLFDGIKKACAGGRIGDISAAVGQRAESDGFSVVRSFVGHGVGRQLHEAPEVPNFGEPGRGARLVNGMTIAIEPMINAGGYQVKILPDGWTVVTEDGSLSAHFEHTVAVRGDSPEILTTPG
jgi:methionyl aminopeptidase